MIKKSDWLAITKDRAAVILLLIMAFFAVALIATSVFRIQPSDIQVPTRFTGYGQSNIDRDQWYTLLGFAGFAVIVVVVNGFLAVKLHAIDRMLGLGLMTLSIFILVVAIVIANAIFNLAPTV